MKLSFRQDCRLILKFLSLTQTRLGSFVPPIVFTLCATGLEGLSYLLLVPTVHLLITGDASAIRRMPYLNRFVDRMPSFLFTPDFKHAFLLIGVVFAIVIFKNMLRVAFNISVISQTRNFTSRLRFLICERFLGFGKLFFDKNNLGYLQHLLMNHPRQIAQSIGSIYQLFYSTAMLAINLFILARISWSFTLVAVVVWPFLNFSIGGIIRHIRSASVQYARVNADMTRKLSNALTCVPLIKACSSEQLEKERFMKPNLSVEKTAAVLEKKKFLLEPIQEISGLALIFLLIGLMLPTLVDKNPARISAYLVFFLVLRRSTSMAGSFSNTPSIFASMRGALDQLDDIFSDENKFYVPGGDREFESLRNEICFKNLSFEYPAGVRALRDVSFEVKKGRMTALVGPTGAGKSTLIHLLMRFYECAPNSVFADGIDLRDFSLKSYHDKVAFISQDTLLFNETIGFNLTYGLTTEASKEAITVVLKQARLNDFVKKLPLGLDTPIGDRGIRLSGGERQRLSIARALLRQSEILILDEATSALDGETERLIQEAIQEVVKGRTTLVVAHRFSTIRNADYIVVMDQGAIAEQGTLNDLLEKKGLFFRLWEAQKFY